MLCRMLGLIQSGGVVLAVTTGIPVALVLIAFGSAMTRHRRALNLVLCLGFGTWLVVRGALAL